MRTVFLGDSITEGFLELRKHGVINLGVSGNRTIEVIERLSSVKETNPEKLFLMIGTNDVMTNHALWFTDFPISIETTYRFIVRYLVENLQTKAIYLLSILPIRSVNVIPQEDEVAINKDIDRLNQFIERLAKEYNINYIDLNAGFKDESGRLKREWTTDGIHLSQQGYAAFYDKIKIFLD